MGIKKRKDRKIITNNNINDLILFSRKNLGLYNLVYKKYKGLYWGMIANTILAIMFCAGYVYFIDKNVKGVTILFFLGCFIFALIALAFSFYLDEESRDDSNNVQNTRLEKLEKYYQKKQFTRHDIIIINEQLRKRIEQIKSNRITIAVVFGMLVLPIWEVFAEKYFVVFTTKKLFDFLQLCIVLAILIIVCIRLYNRWEYLYHENIYIKNNTHIMENLIYLNSYIINNRRVGKRNGKRRGRC